MTISMVISGFVIALVKGWQLALVITATLPLLVLSAVLYMTIIKGKDKKVSAAYATAGGHAEEAIGAVKTVKFLTGEAYEGDKFEH
jgi:ATP-binding cassette subfamily B (MDR/TAP) protein 1